MNSVFPPITLPECPQATVELSLVAVGVASTPTIPGAVELPRSCAVCVEQPRESRKGEPAVPPDDKGMHGARSYPPSDLRVASTH